MKFNEWKLIEPRKGIGEMAKIVKKDDEEFLIAYVLVEDKNTKAREEDLVNAQLIAKAPQLLQTLIEISKDPKISNSIKSKIQKTIEDFEND